MPFDPNKPFTPETAKKAFDPSRSFQSTNGPDNTSSRSFISDAGQKAKALVEGAGQGLTFGNVGNIGGAAQALASYVGKPGQTDRALESQGFKIQQPSAFDVGKQATNAELDKSYNENPWAYRAGYVGGSLPLAGPTRAVYDAAGGGYAGSAGVGMATGYLHDYDVQNPDANLDKVGPGALLGTLLKAPTDLGVKSLGLVGDYAAKAARMTKSQAEAYLKNVLGTEKMAEQLGNVSENPQGMVDLQNQAVDAINNSRKTLKMRGLGDAQKLSESLEGTSSKISPNDYLGHSPEADQALSKYAQTIPEVKGEPVLGEDGVMRYLGGSPEKTAYPESVEMGGNEVNALKRYLQGASRFKPGTITDPVQQARAADAAKKAFQLRTTVEGLSPDAAALNKNMQDSVLLQQSLRQGAKNSPLAFVSSESPDRMAALARAETKGAGGLFDLGNQLGAAKSIAAKDTGSGIMSSPIRAAGRAGLRGVSLFEPAAEQLNDFPLIQQLIQSAGQGAVK